MVSASGPGFVTAFPCATAVPSTSSLNLPAETAVGALAVSSLGAGSLCIFTNVRTHLIVDVLGVWSGVATPPKTPPRTADDGDDLPPARPDAGADGGHPVIDASADVAMAATDAGTPGADGAVGMADRSAPADREAPVADATTPRPEEGALTGGCGCRADGARPPGGALSLGALFALASFARRRRRRRSG